MGTRFPGLSVIALFLLAAGLLVFALPTRAQTQHCEKAGIVDLYTKVHTMHLSQPGYVLLSWSLDINPWPDDFLLGQSTFRVDRRRADGSSWETLATVGNDHYWQGPADPGQWIYRVSLVSLQSGEDTETCDGVTAETAIDVPTESGLGHTVLGELCKESDVIWLQALRPEEGALMLKWEDELDNFYDDVWGEIRVEDPTRFRADTVVYRIERTATAPDNTPLGWVMLAETTERTWTGLAEPGHWTYRVGTDRMTKGSVFVDCESWWAEVHIHIQTEEETAEQERQSAILIAEATRCATETLTSSLQDEAREIVAGYVAQRVSEIVVGSEDENDPEAGFRALVGLTVLLCAEESPPIGYGVSTGPVWGALMLLDFGDWGW